MKTKIILIFFVILIAFNLAYAFSGNNENYTIELGNVDYSAYNGNTSNATLDFSLVDQPIETGSSSNYNVELGFFHGDIVYTPPEPEPPITGGGKGSPGGGTSRIRKDYTFNLMQETIKVSLKPGEVKRKTLQIKNKGDAFQDMRILQQGLENNLILPEKEFLIAPESDLSIPLQFFSSEKQEVGVYTGKLQIYGEKNTKIVVLIVEILPREALFDILVEVKETSKVVSAGEEVDAEIKLLNFGDLKPVDVELNYSILNNRGEVVDFAHETLAVEDEVSLSRSLRTKVSNKPGEYVFSGILKYSGLTVTSTDQFTISEKPKYIIDLWFFFLIAIMIIVLLTILIFTKRKDDKKDKFQSRLDDYIESRVDSRREEDYKKYIQPVPVKKLDEYKAGKKEIMPVSKGEEIIGEKDYIVREYEVKGEGNKIKKYVVKKPIKKVDDYRSEEKAPNVVEALRRRGLEVYGNSSNRKVIEKPKPIKMTPAKAEHSILMNMIQYYREHGYDKESIKEILMDKKWPEKLVDSYLSMVK